jgi:hypothetical protein
MAENVPEKKKRGRKKQTTDNKIEQVPIEKPPPKKRGRKPKGGKIVQNTVILNDTVKQEPNIILHLKCSLNDITNEFQGNYTYTPNVESIQSYNFEKNDISNFLIDVKEKQGSTTTQSNNDKHNIEAINEDEDDNKDNKDMKVIWKKLSALKINLHKNRICDKRSACFWCTHDFDNPPIFIPKNIFRDVYQVYGCFCTPECGAAHLMNEKIDSSVKFERYQLMNNIYGKIYNHTKNIKPAPDPYYLLDKFYGNLSIKEYRELLNKDQLLIIVDKPLTHVFPELYEDNSDFILNQRTIPTNNPLKLKRKSSSVKKTTNILDNLGINKN